jgi:hypothetical protein
MVEKLIVHYEDYRDVIINPKDEFWEVLVNISEEVFRKY